MKHTNTFLPLLVLLLLISACTAQSKTAEPSPDQPVSSEDTPVPSETPLEGAVVREENAIIDEIGLLIMESFPLQVNVNVKGQFPDGCTSIDETWVEKVDDNVFQVHIQTTRPADAMCTQALVPFETNIPLDVNGLPAGTYTVKVYSLSTEFTFEQDNSLPE